MVVPMFDSLTKEDWRKFGKVIVGHRRVTMIELKYHRLEAVAIFTADVQHNLKTREAQEKYGVLAIIHWQEVVCCLACYVLYPDKELTSFRVTKQELETIIEKALKK